jgi:hypothetical protein
MYSYFVYCACASAAKSANAATTRCLGRAMAYYGQGSFDLTDLTDQSDKTDLTEPPPKRNPSGQTAS